MSISDKINSITTHLEDDYTALEQLGVSVEDRNIENIKDMANQIYAKFPKTSYAEGSNITLENTLKGKLDFENDIVGIGDTQQNGTPTPETPIDIEVVRGKNRLKLENGTTTMHNVTSVTENGKITLNGTPNSTDYINLIGTYVANTTDTFTLTPFKSATNSDIRLLYTINDGSLINSDNTPQINLTIGDILKVYLRISSTSQITNFTLQPQLEKGSQATSYLPYNTLEVVERGINELNKDDELRQGGSIGAGTDYVSTRISISCKKKLKANTTYTLVTNLDLSKFYYAFVLGTKIAPWSVEQQLFDSGWKTNINYVSYTTNQECYINIPIRNLAGNTIIPSDIDDYWFMLYEGEYDSSIDYEPYQTPQTYQLSLGEYEFAKIGNYVDTIEYDVENDKVYKNEVINKYQFTGNENFGKAASTNLNGYIFNFPSITTNILAPANNGIKANILSNAFITKAVDTIISEATYGIGIRSDKYLYIGAPLGSFESVSALQTYLANNITFMYYTLETEVKEEITGTLKDQIKALYNSQSFTGTTIIEIDGQLPLIIKVRALKGE